ncbi:MAG: ATPase, T2SS/T4P/T4SS family [Ilumatobacter sp.]|uniref:CpaF family protein n=1 Tax=Ilumatobacter sp. TaxID=1967498 RepID=UPI00329A0D73
MILATRDLDISDEPARRLLDEVCDAVRDSAGDLGELVEGAVRRIAPLATATERTTLRDAAIAQMAGLGELDAFLTDPDVDEVLVNGDAVWIDRNGRVEPAGRLTGTNVEQVIERILAPIGRRVDRTTPIVDARLADGSRVCAVVAPVAMGGAALSIRRFASEVRPLSDFTDAAGEHLLHEIVAARCNVIVSGSTSSGKTSLLASMIDCIDQADRLIVLEDTAELPCRAAHQVRLEARAATSEGLSAVTLGDLVRTALRLRPDRLVVGEVRSDECLALVQAMNTGHDGSFSTCHANGPLDALLRLESLVLQAAPQWPLDAVRQQLARSIDVVVHVDRVDGRRRISSISEVVPPDPHASSTVPRMRTLGESEPNGFVVHSSLRRTRR